MSNVIKFNKGVHPDDEVPKIDVYGQVVLIGIASDLRRHCGSEPDQSRAMELESIMKRLSGLVERYEP